MKTFIANETLLLIDGEVMIVKTSCKKGDTLIDTHSNTIYIANTDSDCLVKYIYKIIASTKQLPNVKQLPREVFVKGVDVKIEAEKFLPKVYSEWEYELFEAGYNANKNEFTMQQMMRAMNLSFTTGALNGDKTSQDILNMIQPLSLPKYLETDNEFNILKIEF